MTDRDLQLKFESLLRQHRKIVMKVAAIYARSIEDRHDLQQEICAQLWRSFVRFDEGRARFSTWTYRVALNVAISQLRRTGSASGGNEPLNEWHLETIAGAEPDNEREQQLKALYALIACFDPLNRALIMLHLEDRSYAEIAAILGISESNVATKISRIKSKLRDQVKNSTLTGE
jgi:RNA polymerase sigma factor (sigma-70 family)